MLEEEIDFEGIDEICGSIQNLSDTDLLTDIAGSYSISAPLK